jgi:hypothetical protein
MSRVAEDTVSQLTSVARCTPHTGDSLATVLAKRSGRAGRLRMQSVKPKMFDAELTIVLVPIDHLDPSE